MTSIILFVKWTESSPPPASPHREGSRMYDIPAIGKQEFDMCINFKGNNKFLSLSLYIY